MLADDTKLQRFIRQAREACEIADASDATVATATVAGDEARISAGRAFLALREIVDESRQTWIEWCQQNIDFRSVRDIQRLMKIARSADPSAALAAERDAAQQSMQQTRDKRLSLSNQSSEPPDDLAERVKRINACFAAMDAADAACLRIAQKLMLAREIIDREAPGTWETWCAENINCPMSDIRRFLIIGRADNKLQDALTAYWERNRTRSTTKADNLSGVIASII